LAQSRCADQPLSPQARIGVNVAREEGKEITDYAVDAIGAGWYLDYTWHRQPAHPGGMDYYPMLRPGRLHLDRLDFQVGPAVDANPGSTWILGNEPDNWAQDGLTPAQYATFYHTLYHFLKARDPSSQIAIAAVTAVTPLRLRYLDAVLASYQAQYGVPMPIDVWTVHIYLLAEQDQGGIGIPPGLEAYRSEALTFALADHDSLPHFADQVTTFRHWLAARGYRQQPLILSEYGVLLPASHGFDAARVRAFMVGSFAYLQSARHPQTGLPSDGNRLVQRWAWFSLNYYAFEEEEIAGGLQGLNGNLFTHGTGAITDLGRAFGDYLRRLTTTTVDLAVLPPQTMGPGNALTIVNRGDTPATGFQLRIGWGDTWVGHIVSQQPLAARCGNQLVIPLTWYGMSTDQAGSLQIQLLPLAQQREYDLADNRATIPLGR